MSTKELDQAATTKEREGTAVRAIGARVMAPEGMGTDRESLLAQKESPAIQQPVPRGQTFSASERRRRLPPRSSKSAASMPTVTVDQSWSKRQRRSNRAVLDENPTVGGREAPQGFWATDKSIRVSHGNWPITLQEDGAVEINDAAELPN